jgi:hypothetical protein
MFGDGYKRYSRVITNQRSRRKYSAEGRKYKISTEWSDEQAVIKKLGKTNQIGKCTLRNTQKFQRCFLRYINIYDVIRKIQEVENIAMVSKERM